MPGFINRFLERRRMEREGQLGTRKRRTESLFIAAVDRSTVLTRILVVVLWALCIMVLSLPGKRNYPQLVAGQTAPFTVFARADFDCIDQTATEARRQEIAGAQPAFFRIDDESTSAISHNSELLIEAVSKRSSSMQQHAKYVGNNKIAEKVASLGPGAFEYLGVMNNSRHSEEFRNYLQQLLPEGIVADSAPGSISSDGRVRLFDSAGRNYGERSFKELLTCSHASVKLSEWFINRSPAKIAELDREALQELMMLVLENRGNLLLDEQYTAQQRELVLKEVPPIIINFKKNDVVISRNEAVSRQHLNAIEQEKAVIKQLEKDDNMTENIFRTAFWSALLLLFSAIYLKHIHPEITRSSRSIAMIVTICAMSLGINYLAMETFYFFSGALSIPPELILYSLPLALPAILLTVMAGYRVALYVGFFVAMVSALMLQGSFNAALEGFVLSALCGLVVRKSNNYRSFFLRSFFCVAITVWVMDFNWYWHLLHAPLILVYSLLLALGNALFTAIAALLLTFLFELIFNVSTNMSLMVLCDYNHPLLKELHLKAPGTSLHSQNVAVLAENAAMAIGANAVLARAGALFHDIGKIKNPEYFIENNQNGSNPHNKLNPRMSSIIISNHVKDGLDMALQYKLCRKVRQFIQQHHGTDLIKYFYFMAQNSDEKVLESDYRYPGPLPMHKEVVIVSLADACEAACRSLEKPTAAKIEGMVNDIFRQRWRDGQLDNSELTVHELAQLSESFIHTLTTMYHSRIAYPKDENNDEDDILISERPAAGTEPKAPASGNA